MKTLEDILCRQPETLREALTLLSDEATRGVLLSGGTDLIVQWQAGAVPMPEQIIDLSAVPELKNISEQDGRILIGAGVTHAAIRNHALTRGALPALVASCASIGARQIQSRGTLGGNVANASPAGDASPALLVADACVVTASLAGERCIPMKDFLLDYRKIDRHPDELILRFELTPCPKGGIELFSKIGTRGAQAISKVMGACRIVMHKGIVEQIALALGSVAATAIRLPETEALLTGKTLTEKLVDEAEACVMQEVHPIADIRSTAEYRRWVSGRIVRGFLASRMTGFGPPSC